MEIERVQRGLIREAERRIAEAREAADQSPPPIRRREATAADIIEGAIIWHMRETHYGGDYWHVVAEVLRPSDDFKAYCADDGCRYGLMGAYVEVAT